MSKTENRKLIMLSNEATDEIIIWSINYKKLD